MKCETCLNRRMIVSENGTQVTRQGVIENNQSFREGSGRIH